MRRRLAAPCVCIFLVASSASPAAIAASPGGSIGFGMGESSDYVGLQLQVRYGSFALLAAIGPLSGRSINYRECNNGDFGHMRPVTHASSFSVGVRWYNGEGQGLFVGTSVLSYHDCSTSGINDFVEVYRELAYSAIVGWRFRPFHWS